MGPILFCIRLGLDISSTILRSCSSIGLWNGSSWTGMGLGESGIWLYSDSSGTETRISNADRCDCWGLRISLELPGILMIWLAAYGRNSPKVSSCFLLFLYRRLRWFLLSIGLSLSKSSLRLLLKSSFGCFFSSSIFKLLSSSSLNMLKMERFARLNRDAEFDLTVDFAPPLPGPSCNFSEGLRGRTFADLLMLLSPEPV